MGYSAYLVHGLLDEAVQRRPAAAAVRDMKGVWTYAELDAKSRALTRSLSRRGVAPGDRVVALLPNCRTLAALVYGAVRLGATLVPLVPSSTAYQLCWLLRDAAPTVIVVEDGKAEPIRSLTLAAVMEESSLYDDHDDDAPVAASPGPGPQPDDTALFLYTSGSTGRPHAVVCPHERVVFAARAIAAKLRYNDGDIVYGRLPFSFDYGLYQLFLCTIAGAELVFPPVKPEALLWSGISKSGATIAPLTPALTEILARLSSRRALPTPVRMVTSTGAPLTRAHAATLRQAFPRAALVRMYGMTECKRISIAEPDDHHRSGASGTALPGTRIMVVDENGRPVHGDTVGQIISIGPHVMAGYHNAPDATAYRFRPAPDSGEPAVYTGDYGRMDNEGHLYVLGRSDDLFKRRGRRTSTYEIEAAILDIPGVLAAAVAPPGPDGELVAWVVGPHAKSTVLAGVGERLGPALIPDRCMLVAELPHTINGKVDRQRLRSSAMRGRGGGG